MTDSAEDVIGATRTWLEKAVIGLGLCPFAAKVQLRDQIRYVVSAHSLTDGLIQDLTRESQDLHVANPELCETTLLIHPQVLNDFHDYNEFLAVADATLLALNLEGELQIASFHPQYRFAGSDMDDIENFTNRSPYPMLHLLREASVTHAIEAFPGVHDIDAKNAVIMRTLGHAGWKRLWAES